MFDKIKAVTSSENNAGFTFVELMAALTIGLFLLLGFYSAYIVQKNVFMTQDRVAIMQQNLRAGMRPMVDTIRMAGYDPTGTADCAGFNQATPGRIDISADLNGDGDCADPKEKIQFGFTIARDADNNGIPDDGKPAALREQFNTGSGPSGYQEISDNIESFEFNYLDKDGLVTTDLTKIKMVQISLLAISDKPDKKFTNALNYDPASGVNPNWKRATTIDNFRRRLLITTVVCRNMGI